YWALAQNFVLNDATFSSEEGASYVNHLMSVSGAAGPDIPHSATTNPRLSSGSSTHYWGCDAPSDTFTILLNGTKQFPCFNYRTFMDDLTAHGISWKFYADTKAGDNGYQWDAPDTFSQDRGTTNNVPESQFLTDIQNKRLPAFSWVTYSGIYSEHPPA